MPVLYILGGANGVGKTTWYHYGIQMNYVDQSLPFINVDIIQKELGGYTTANTLKAEAIVRVRLAELITLGKDLMIESNLAKSSDYEWIDRMRKEGYDTHLFFLGTTDVAINKQRVAQRVKEGGHQVSDAIIEHRYTIGLSYLKSKILSFTDVKLIDSSLTKPRVSATLKDGRVVYKETNCPAWVNESLFIAERLLQKEQESV